MNRLEKVTAESGWRVSPSETAPIVWFSEAGSFKSQKLIAASKNPLKQASFFGLDTVLLLLLRQLTLEDAAQRVSKNIGLKARAIVCPYAEVGMDVDKPHQLDLMRADLAQK